MTVDASTKDISKWQTLSASWPAVCRNLLVEGSAALHCTYSTYKLHLLQQFSDYPTRKDFQLLERRAAKFFAILKLAL